MSEESKPKVGKELVTLAEASRLAAEASIEHKDWSGLPIPVVGLDLVLEPRYKHQGLSDFRWKEFYDEEGNRHAIEEPPPPTASGFQRINSWWSSRFQVRVIVIRDKNGRSQVRFLAEDKMAFTLRTLEAAAVWPVEAEKKAQQKLAELIPAESFELYSLTGQFAEESTRSGVTYLFRRGRPTIALRMNEECSYSLCALCLHPIGYYADTWAGVMCPSDEVIAHLLMMRGSEEKYWANANQHPLDRPAAGV